LQQCPVAWGLCPMGTCWHKHKRNTLSQQRALDAYSDHILTEHYSDISIIVRKKSKVEEVERLCLCPAAVSTSPNTYYVYAYACVKQWLHT